MRNVKNLTCIQCPLGCNLNVTLAQGRVISITGNSCKRGAEYARQESTAPRRTLTGTISISDSALKLLPVVSASPLPKDKLFDCMKLLQNISIAAPVKMGEVVLPNIGGLGINILASRSVDKL